MILRFAVDLAVGFTSNQAERDVRPVKVQQRASGGTWRTLLGLADFAIVQSYLSTAAKCGIDALDALTRLFTDGPLHPIGYPHAVLAFQHVAYVGRLALIVRCALKEKRGVQVGQVGFHADGPAIDFVRISIKHPRYGLVR